MFNKNPLSFVLDQIEQRTPEALQPLQQAGKRFLKEQSPFVSREEFEAQQIVLAQALQRLEELEKRLAGVA